MAPDHTRGNRITIDRLFALAPHDLIADVHISPPAFRLWCVLHMMIWLHEPPDMERLQERMNAADPPTRRSIYRWLGELEAAGWLEWQRSPGKSGVNDRFALKTKAEPVTPESQLNEPVTPESQPVIVGSHPVTPESQAPPIHPLPEPLKQATQIFKDHEDHDDDDGRALETYLLDQGMYPATVRQITAMHLDRQTVITSVDNLLAASWGIGPIGDRLRAAPPSKGHPYERPDSGRADSADHGRNGTGRGNGGDDRQRAHSRAPRPGAPEYYEKYRTKRPDSAADSERAGDD